MSSWEAGEWCRKGLARALCGVPWGLVSTAPTAGKLALAVVSLPLPPPPQAPTWAEPRVWRFWGSVPGIVREPRDGGSGAPSVAPGFNIRLIGTF